MSRQFKSIRKGLREAIGQPKTGSVRGAAEYDAETRFRARAARGAGKSKRGLQLLAKARGERRARRAG